MNFRDTIVTCQECGTSFVYTVEKQRELAERGMEVRIPDLCEACTQAVKYGGRRHGRVKWFSAEKGYGFIVQDNGSEIFLHRQGIPLTEEGALPSLADGQEVLYEVIDTPKGPQAVQVTHYQTPAGDS
jgi:CspA family cold shock protein